MVLACIKYRSENFKKNDGSRQFSFSFNCDEYWMQILSWSIYLLACYWHASIELAEEFKTRTMRSCWDLSNQDGCASWIAGREHNLALTEYNFIPFLIEILRWVVKAYLTIGLRITVGF